MPSQSPTVPTVDLLRSETQAAAEIAQACADFGFFRLRNHGLDRELQHRIDRLSREFFALPLEQKMRISMDQGGLAWRGFFPVGQELTSGRADLKEGLYFGSDLAAQDPRVLRGLPLHGANLYPDIPGFRDSVLEYLRQLERIGHTLMRLLSLGLGLEADYFRDHYTADPTLLFRIFHYPADLPVAANTFLAPNGDEEFTWGVGEHTDYGVLTLLQQDDCGGLQIKTRDGTWFDVAPEENFLVCNVGDMLDFLTRGRYRSAPHRVKNRSGRSRLSFPFFFDPHFESLVRPLPLKSLPNPPGTVENRWDQAKLYDYQGSYGDYLLRKVSKVFPLLAAEKLRRK